MLRSQVRSCLHWVQSWFAQVKTTDPDDRLDALPPAAHQSVARQVQALPVPPAACRFVREELTAALETWQRDREAPNSLAILTAPVESAGALLRAALTDWEPPTDRTIAVAPDWIRPADPLRLRALLQSALATVEDEALPAADPDDPLSARRTLVMLPALDACFLRCIGGWEGVEYLRERVDRDRDRFWLIGCNAWAWQFLDAVCQIGAYFDRVECLPHLNRDDLEAWLGPLAAEVVAAESQAGKAEGETRRDSPPKTRAAGENGTPSWSALAEVSSGIGATAAELWLASLRVRASDREGAEAAPDGETPSFEIGPIQPILPSLPTLEATDRYILHDLLVHGPLSRSHLALSLGDAESILLARLQVLRRAGAIVRRGGDLAIHPALYPKLRTELRQNNFLVGKL